MKTISFFIISILLLPLAVYSQQKFTLSGNVNDEHGKPLPGCHVHFSDQCVFSEPNGGFVIKDYPKDTILLRFSFIGHESLDTLIDLTKVRNIDISLQNDLNTISQVDINANKIDTEKTRKNEVVSTEFITQNLSSTFIKSIEKLPGINSMDIGANASKPIVRGMGFNRVVVSENGIKQEGQQWGADHGLELDPFSVESAEIVKGASAIEHGSEAIGGYINVSNDNIPKKNSLDGNINLIGKSVNKTIGASAFFKGRGEKVFFKFRSTMLEFGDYHIPTDTIVYLTRKMPIVNQQLKNTAGKEFDAYGQFGYLGNHFQTRISVSNVFQESGFFPGAHGIPDLERIKDDGDKRNIEFPYQNASHLKLINNTKVFVRNSILFADLAFQNNHRQEWSLFHTHYPGQLAPEEETNLELDFNLKTYNANLKYEFEIESSHKFGLAIQNQWKENRIDGYNFLLPAYDNYALGFFIKDDYSINNHLKLTAALRFDFSQINTQGFYDPILYNYFIGQNSIEEDARFYANRSIALEKQYNDFSWLIGAVYTSGEKTIFRINIGKAFRTPTAIELASNGIHHGSFRHEVGNNNLKSEKGYYLDGNFEWNNLGFGISFSPYFYYFTNYIFLNPSGSWSSLPHAGQIYEYTQSRAILSGAELSFNKSLFEKLKVYASFEYIYNKQLASESSKQYPLPFTPPANAFIELDYFLLRSSKTFSKTKLFVNSRLALKQENIAQNEEKTPGYVIYGAGFSTKIKTKNNHVDIVLQASNLLDTKYFNHISFYRKLEIPEMGRNLQLLVKVPVTLKK